MTGLGGLLCFYGLYRLLISERGMHMRDIDVRGRIPLFCLLFSLMWMPTKGAFSPALFKDGACPVF